MNMISNEARRHINNKLQFDKTCIHFFVGFSIYVKMGMSLKKDRG